MKYCLSAVVLGVCFSGGVAEADLYCGHVASLEWKVHSSDAIYRVQLAAGKKKERPLDVQLLETIKAPAKPLKDRGEILRGWRIPLNIARSGQEWLLFVRTWDDKAPTISHVVNLSYPLKASRTSAVTADGVPLTNRTAVLKAIAARLKLNRKLSPRERKYRDQVDAGPKQDHFHVARHGNADDLGPWLGGFMKRIDCSFWDTPVVDEDQRDDPPLDEDLWLNYAVVPADLEYRDDLLKAAACYDKPHAQQVNSPFADPRTAILALANYPGEKAKALATTVSRSRTHHNRIGSMILNYFKFHAMNNDPRNQTLIGRWRIEGQREAINVELLKNGRFRAHGWPKPFPNPDQHRREWWGNGRWVVSFGELSVIRETVRLSRDSAGMSHGTRGILFNKRIRKTSETEILLDGGPRMFALPTTQER